MEFKSLNYFAHNVFEKTTFISFRNTTPKEFLDHSGLDTSLITRLIPQTNVEKGEKRAIFIKIDEENVHEFESMLRSRRHEFTEEMNDLSEIT